MLKKLIPILLLCTGTAVFASDISASKQNYYCNYLAGKTNPSNGAAVLDLISTKNGIAKVLVIGFPKVFTISVNDIDSKKFKIKEDDFKCHGKTVGFISYYDLNRHNMDAGFLKIRADKETVEKSLTFN